VIKLEKVEKLKEKPKVKFSNRLSKAFRSGFRHTTKKIIKM